MEKDWKVEEKEHVKNMFAVRGLIISLTKLDEWIIVIIAITGNIEQDKVKLILKIILSWNDLFMIASAILMSLVFQFTILCGITWKVVTTFPYAFSLSEGFSRRLLRFVCSCPYGFFGYNNRTL